MRAPQNIIRRPLLTEKSTILRETGGGTIMFGEEADYAQKITFEVATDANKIEIRAAVKQLFKVEVTNVHTLNSRGKIKRVGKNIGRRPATKKAIVTLKAGETIEFFEGV